MPLWGKIDQANNAPKQRVTDQFEVGNVAGRTKATIANTYANSTISGKHVVTTLGVDVTEAAGTDAVVHPGWVVKRQGTGPVLTIAILGGTGYTNGNVITVSNGAVNATATIVTNGTGNAASASVSVAGAGFINATAIAVAVANSTGGATGAGTGATITVTLGGRAGRKHFETMVAMGSIGTSPDGDGSLI
jgi:hypothetical protein